MPETRDEASRRRGRTRLPTGVFVGIAAACGGLISAALLHLELVERGWVRFLVAAAVAVALYLPLRAWWISRRGKRYGADVYDFGWAGDASGGTPHAHGSPTSAEGAFSAGEGHFGGAGASSDWGDGSGDSSGGGDGGGGDGGGGDGGGGGGGD